MIDLKELGEEIHSTAKEKGWWDTDRNDGEAIALIHSELSEALEDLRLPVPYWNEAGIAFEKDGQRLSDKDAKDLALKGEILKPVGPAVEFADVIIRVIDLCRARGWQVDEAMLLKVAYNKTRPRRHGGKKY